ncbi:MAG: aspartate/glutamate racemase family protein [Alphaproteobacteria bacterium]
MHIGLVGGIGPAATDYYYRGLILALADHGKDLELTIAHAATSTLLENLGREDQAAQAAIFLRLLARLKSAGAQAAAITSIAGHFCIDEVKQASPLPIIDIVKEVDIALASRKLRKVGLIGTKKVMESRFYGGISSVEIVVPAEPERQRVHRNYVAMAVPGRVTDQQRQVFFSAGRSLCQDQGAEAVMLGGTDLFLAFDGRDCGFEVVDCAGIHVEALAKAAAES